MEIGIISRIKDIIFKIKDYNRLESDYCTCLCYFTNNKMSKPNYKIDVVETVIADSIGEYIDEGYDCAKKDFMEEAKAWFADAMKAKNDYKMWDEFEQHMKTKLK